MVYNRWGRVGIKGQDKLFGPYTSRDSAIQEFEQKFFAKTKNHWSTRKEFICHPKSYTWLEMDYGEQEKESDVSTPDSKFIFFLKVLYQTQLRSTQFTSKMHFDKGLAN